MTSKRLTIYFVTIFLLASRNAVVYGQQGTGKIAGLVADSSGAVVPGASIHLINSDTGVVQEATTNSTGLYTLSSIPVGNYSLEATKQGFAKVVHSVVHIDVDIAITINLVLKVGIASQTV